MLLVSVPFYYRIYFQFSDSQTILLLLAFFLFGEGFGHLWDFHILKSSRVSSIDEGILLGPSQGQALYIKKKKTSHPPCFPIHTHSLVFLLLSTHNWSWKTTWKAKKQWMRELIDFEINNTQLHHLLCE